MRSETRQNSIGRRGFLARAGAAAGVTVLGPSLVRGGRANAAVSIGLIGCGGRGTWIAELFEKSGKYRISACADYFPEKADAFGQKFGIDPKHRYTTLSGYKRVLDAGVDAVVIESPPYCHPEQAAAAVEAGKHVYLAKPIAVDVPGCLSVEASGKKATAKNLVFLVDFQTRTDPIFQETVKRVRAGAIGRLVSGRANYPWSVVLADVDAPTPEAKLRSWYQVLAFCGDTIVEQDIHAIDVATWLADAAPVKAVGSRGALIRKHGNISDRFSVIYTFPNDLVVSFTSQKGVPGIKDEIRCQVLGTEGVADTDYSGEVKIDGDHPFAGGRMGDLYGDGARRNIDDFYDRIAAGRFDNPTVAPSVRSNLTCVLGRTAAYRGREVTWEELIHENEAVPPDLTGLKS